MDYLIAVLGLGAACILWYLVQRWAREEGDDTWQADDPRCERCEKRGPDCPSSISDPE